MNGYDILADAEAVAAAYDRSIPSRAPDGWTDAAKRANRCPTCDDGILTISTPARCRECIAGGL